MFEEKVILFSFEYRSDKFHDKDNISNAIFVEISPLISYAGEVGNFISKINSIECIFLES